MDASDGRRAAPAAAPGGHGGAPGRKRFGELFGPVLLSPIDALEDARQRLKQRRLQPAAAAAPAAAAGPAQRRARRVRFDVADGSDMDEDDEWEDEDDEEPRKQGGRCMAPSGGGLGG